ncbi:MAG: hypothetical protein J7K35_08870 [Syntrophobacterales bacterium]|nr:hypothetical protein [Syntrophobacterales bacterium]
MKKKRFGFTKLVMFLLYPEDSTDRYPDTFFTPHGFSALHVPKYLEVMKTLFWMFIATLLATVISQFCQ